MAKQMEAQALKRFENAKAKAQSLYEERTQLDAKIERQRKTVIQACIDLVMALSIGSTVHYPTYPIFGKAAKLGGRTGKIYKKGRKYVYVDFGGDVGKWRIQPGNLAEGSIEFDEAMSRVAADVRPIAEGLFTGGV